MDELSTLIARVSEAIRGGHVEDHCRAYDAATELRRAAERLENAAISEELAPWWEDPDPQVRVSRR